MDYKLLIYVIKLFNLVRNRISSVKRKSRGQGRRQLCVLKYIQLPPSPLKFREGLNLSPFVSHREQILINQLSEIPLKY